MTEIVDLLFRFQTEYQGDVYAQLDSFGAIY